MWRIVIRKTRKRHLLKGSTHAFGPDTRALAVVLAIAAAVLGVEFVLMAPWRPLTRENGPVETVQHVTLAATTVVWLLAARRASRRRGSVPPGQASVSAALAVLAFLALCRELSWLKVFGSDAHQELEAIGSVVCGAVLLLLGWRWLRSAGSPVRRAAAVLSSRPLLLVYLAGALLVIGEGFEKGNMLQPSSEALEEVAELVGHAVFLVAAIVDLRAAAGRPVLSRPLTALRWRFGSG